MSGIKRIEIEGRNIFIVTGRVSQTVNVCDATNRRGNYEYVIRLFQPNFVNEEALENQDTIEEIVNWLMRKRQGQIEKSPDDDEVDIQGTPADQPLDSKDVVWVERAMRITEVCIDELVREFLEIPYLHRVEHSTHTRLYSILSTQPHLSRHFPLADGETMTQPIHKEWPEPIPREEKGNRRGNIDLAILPPGRLRNCNLKDFSNGRLVPPIAIEMGLNYGEGHLAADAEKLLNSKIQHGYLVHLVRELPHDPTINQTIEKFQSEKSIRIAFARYEQGRKYLKLLDDHEIREIE